MEGLKVNSTTQKQDDGLDKLDSMYTTQSIEEKRYKPIIANNYPLVAGLLLIVPAIFLAPTSFFFIIYSPDPALAILMAYVLVMAIVDIIAGIYCIQRQKHQFVLIASVVGIFALDLLAIGTVLLVMASEDQFKS
jgi:hypothetical protein